MAGDFRYINKGHGTYDVWTEDGRYLGRITKTPRGAWSAWKQIRPHRIYKDRLTAAEALKVGT